MQVTVTRSSEVSFDEAESCLVVPVYERTFPLNSEVLSEADELTLQALADKETITGKAQECYYLATPNSAYKGVLVAGLGKPARFNAETLRRTGGAAASVLQKNRVAHLCMDLSHHGDLPVAAFIEGIALGQYNFEVYKEKKEDEAAPVKVGRVTVVVPDNAEVEAVSAACRLAVLVSVSTNGARHLANTPSNEMTPAALADFARGVAEESGCECDVLEQTQMASLGMNALLGVARGSAEPPRLIVLRYQHPEATKTVAIVGKGITFDSGGISIKPAHRMHEMKYDMAGAAAALCTMMTIAEVKPAINVIGVAPAAENKTGADAQRPGDIVKAYNGKTIEVHNTDAEGRLILADAMAYAVDKYKPDAIVDIATLTGACVVALGHYAAGILGTNDGLVDALIRSGEATGERLWRLPLWDEYDELMKGTHADLCNIGPEREAGAVTAACFLQHFVGDTPWAHLDIAGTANGGKNISYMDSKHARGFGVRLLTQWILDEAARKESP